MSKAFGLLNTNVNLTTNIKIIVDGNYNLFLDTFDSNSKLSLDRYKRYPFNYENYYEDLLPIFFNETPKDDAFEMLNNSLKEEMSIKFENQHDDSYRGGVSNIVANKYYDEDFECFAPLYIDKKVPSNFIVFRVDGPGFESVNRDNFDSEILKKLKTVKVFDLSEQTNIGKWMYRNFIYNQSFPDSPLTMDFNKGEFSVWRGLDYHMGGYAEKSVFMEDIIGEDNDIYDFEKYVTQNYSELGIVFPNILNLTFLFDDTPSTPNSIKKWSINRYFGFYIDGKELISKATPFKLPELRTDVEILQGNLLYSPSSPGNPFKEKWDDSKLFHIEYNGNFYLVERNIEYTEDKIQKTDKVEYFDEVYSNNKLIKFNIISDIDLQGEQNNINKNYIYIENGILKDNQGVYSINQFDESDVWIIKIDDVYHNIIKNELGELVLSTDYDFSFNETNYIYRKGGKETIKSLIINQNNTPYSFEIFRLNFSALKNFDTKFINTDYASFEYEKEREITETEEPKFYMTNLADDSYPKGLDECSYAGKVVNIPASSEYAISLETFRVDENSLTNLWDINVDYCRWGAKGSLGHQDKPYLLNSSSVMGEWNLQVDLDGYLPKRSSKNLDYFYSINSSPGVYLNHSLHLEEYENGGVNQDFNFDLNRYLNISGTYSEDYFSLLFDKKYQFNNGKIIRNNKKYATFNNSDFVQTNSTLFKGINFEIYNVQSVLRNTFIENINVEPTNDFDDYKFSILLSDNRNYFSEETCFPLEMKKILVYDIKINTGIILWDIANDYYYTNSEFINPETLIGLSFFINGEVSEYYISGVELQSGILYKLIINDGSDNEITSSIGIENSPIVLCLYESHIAVPSDYTFKLEVDDIVTININSIDKDYIISNIYNDSNTIKVIPTNSTGNIYVYVISSDESNDLLFAEISTSLINEKNYYTVENNLGFVIWNGTRWEYTSDLTEPYDIYAYSESESPISNDWVLGENAGEISSINTSYAGVDFSESNGEVCHTYNYTSNDMRWAIINQWETDKMYKKGDIVMFDSILYECLEDTIETRPTIPYSALGEYRSAPYLLDTWTYYQNDENIFWSPESSNNFVLNNGIFYKFVNLSEIDFWNPDVVKSGGYSIDDIVIYKGEQYQSMTSSNIYAPDYKINKTKARSFTKLNGDKYWQKIKKQDSKWQEIEMWTPSKNYAIGDYVIYDNGIYLNIVNNTSGVIPSSSENWDLEYNLGVDTDYVYKNDDNPIIKMNGTYYLCLSNKTNSTLENGIKIYINKKWKNILVNIEINDNTLPNIKNANRDELYRKIYSKLSARSFLLCLNNLDKKYGFSDYLEYIIINEDNSINRYDFNNIEELPHILTTKNLVDYKVKINNTIKNIIPTRMSPLVKNKLSNKKLELIDNIDWYNNLPIAYSFTKNEYNDMAVENSNGSIRDNKNIHLKRHSYDYEPLFVDLPLFNRDFNRKLIGNYKFDTSLTDFGIAKEIKIKKVNSKDSILKLKNSEDLISIYPHIDEVGHSVKDINIFKSNWDNKFLYEFEENKAFAKKELEELKSNINVGQSQLIKNNKILKT